MADGLKLSIDTINDMNNQNERDMQEALKLMSRIVARNERILDGLSDVPELEHMRFGLEALVGALRAMVAGLQKAHPPR